MYLNDCMEYLEKQSNPVNLAISTLPFSLGVSSNLTNTFQFFTEKLTNNFLFYFDYLQGRLLSFLNYLYELVMFFLGYFSSYKFCFFFNFIMRSGHL